MNNEELLNTLHPDYHQNPDMRKCLRLVPVTLTVDDCALVCSLLDSLWVHPDSWHYSDSLLELPDQIKHCVAAKGLTDPFDYEYSQWRSRLKYEREKRLRALLEFVYKHDQCSALELAHLAQEVFDDCDSESDRETHRFLEEIKHSASN